MSGIGAKLSKHVLGMKFMKKTKDQCDKEKVQPGHFKSEAQTSAKKAKTETSRELKNEFSTPSASPAPVVEEMWSYNQCERYIFGRQSFGGFNPTVEKNVKKGIWRPFYLEDSV